MGKGGAIALLFAGAALAGGYLYWRGTQAAKEAAPEGTGEGAARSFDPKTVLDDVKSGAQIVSGELSEAFRKATDELKKQVEELKKQVEQAAKEAECEESETGDAAEEVCEKAEEIADAVKEAAEEAVEAVAEAVKPEE